MAACVLLVPQVQGGNPRHRGDQQGLAPVRWVTLYFISVIEFVLPLFEFT